MELSIQKYLSIHGLEKTLEDFSLNHQIEDGLVLLNYNMIDSPRGVPEVDECRGLKLRIPKDGSTEWEIVSMPFYRFYNHGEFYASEIDLTSDDVVFFEKLDGSLIDLYYFEEKEKWFPSTRGTLFANGGVGYNEEKTFADLFWEAWSNTTEFDVNLLPKEYNFIFELTSPENRIVTQYDVAGISILASRKNHEELSLDELNEIGKMIGIPVAKTYPLSNLEEVQEMMAEIHPLDEGFVGVDYGSKKNGSYARIKMKNPRYLAAGKLIGAGEGSFDGKNALRVCLAGEVDEICEYFPEFADAIFSMKKEMGLICEEIDKVYSEIKYLAESDGTPDGVREGKKNFAQAAKSCKHTAALFAILAGKTSQRTGKVFTCGNDYIYSMSLVNLAQLMGVKGD